MTIQNMASVNTLIREGYLLAGVLMAANMFVGNEMRASDTLPTENDFKNNKELNINDSNPDLKNINGKKTEKIETGAQKNGDVPGTIIFVKVLSHENIINLFGGLAFSCVNNYFKWWDYNPGVYRQFGCLGWKSKRFLYGVLQFEVNFNLGRGALWSIPNIVTLIRIKTSEKSESEESKKDGNFSLICFFFISILRGFTSMPFTFHISKFNFSISISIDSIIWMGICKISELKDEKYMEKK